MEHGTRTYFKELTRSSRRVSQTCAGIGIVLLGAVFAPLLPPVHRALEAVSEEVPILRFGFEGPKRVVELVEYNAVPGEGALQSVGKVRAPRTRRGGGEGEAKPAPRGDRTPSRGLEGEGGTEADDLVKRALSGQTGLPLFQSDDLILDHLVRPIYPEESRAKGSEGRVGVIALVDTLGNVKETALLARSGDPLLDRASIVAVEQCRFRPYQQNGVTTEVYAVFRFVFRVY